MLAPNEKIRTPSPRTPYPVQQQSWDETLVSTLPVLVALPLMVIALDLTLQYSQQKPHIALQIAAHIFVLLLQTGAIVCLGVLLATFKLVELSSGRTLWTLLAALFLLSCASLLLPYTRCATILFCLFANKWNFATPLLFLYDIYTTEDKLSLSLAATVAGYGILICSYILFSESDKKSHGSLAMKPVFVFPVVLIGGLCLVLILGDSLSAAFMTISVFTLMIVLFLAPDASILTNANIAIIAAFSYCLECFVLSTKQFTIVDAVACVIVPACISIDRSWQFEGRSGVTSSQADKPKILAEILSHKDTGAIFNFLLLNTAFMFVQLLYSFRSKSLGLLSDSLHMALDCASLALGLVAGILSKNPIDANSKYPFGLKNFEILAGFANGTLLLGVSGSIIFEAIGRLFNPVALQQTTELIVVSILGLLVNIVGIFAFNHGHSHSHGGGHSHSHATSHSHGHSQDHSHSHITERKESDCEESHEMNDNMRGIFLHIMADTLGSVGVVISTILTQIFKWQGFDPVASIIIAVLIFATALPLIKSTVSTLLLRLNSDKEAIVRNALNDLTTIKGVKSFTTPRFWVTDNRLGGFIHIQIYRGENGSYLRKQCESVFSSHKIDVIIQVENDYDSCWCRA